MLRGGHEDDDAGPPPPPPEEDEDVLKHRRDPPCLVAIVSDESVADDDVSIGRGSEQSEHQMVVQRGDAPGLPLDEEDDCGETLKPSSSKPRPLAPPSVAPSPPQKNPTVLLSSPLAGPPSSYAIVDDFDEDDLDDDDLDDDDVPPPPADDPPLGGAAAPQRQQRRGQSSSSQHHQQHHNTRESSSSSLSSKKPPRLLPSLLPALEPLSIIAQKRSQYCGPTDESNWAIPGRLMVGAYPGSTDDVENDAILSSILREGITTFVCLQREYDPRATERQWRSGAALRPYFSSAVALAARGVSSSSMSKGEDDDTPPKVLRFVHFGIEDCGVGEDGAVTRFAVDLADRLRSTDEVIYLHCWGGHGRAGTIACLLLHILYGLDARAAMTRCQFVHDTRRVPIAVGSPQTQKQRDQVARIVGRLQARRDSSAPVVSSSVVSSAAASSAIIKKRSSNGSSSSSHKAAPSRPKSLPKKHSRDPSSSPEPDAHNKKTLGGDQGGVGATVAKPKDPITPGGTLTSSSSEIHPPASVVALGVSRTPTTSTTLVKGSAEDCNGFAARLRLPEAAGAASSSSSSSSRPSPKKGRSSSAASSATLTAGPRGGRTGLRACNPSPLLADVQAGPLATTKTPAPPAALGPARPGFHHHHPHHKRQGSIGSTGRHLRLVATPRRAEI